ncbi:DUF4762 family protein [Ewingella americana]|jgi:hypothetical protein|uniref:DUF4762 family protein n=1 Tax=Ewingella americana TaxID=41202 RepID=UPI00163A5999|nr:DUF4762 family protein [Ewingella americana]QMV51926.1 DUF4762 domain-containing protein [Ewingella americana]
MKKMTMSQAATIVGGTFKSYCSNTYEQSMGPNGKPACYSVKTCTDKHGVINKKMTVSSGSNCLAN